MYPTLADLLKDILGGHLPQKIYQLLSVVNMFGLMMALSFFAAAYTLVLELRRRKTLGQIQAVYITITEGEAASPIEIATNAVIGFILGFKLGLFVVDFNGTTADLPAAIFSTKGNWLIGLIGAILLAGLNYYEKRKQQLATTISKQVELESSAIVSEIVVRAAIGGLLGAKLFHLFEYWDDFIADPAGMVFSGSGLTFYGGLIVGSTLVYMLAKKYKMAMGSFMDATAPGLMLAYGIGRLGCQLAGDGDWGIDNLNPMPKIISWMPDWVWAYNYPHNVNNEGVLIPDCVGKHCAMLPVPVFPTPLYEVVMCLSLFVLLWIIRKQIAQPGRLLAIYLMLNGAERFLIEQIRVNSFYHFWGIKATQAEIIALLFILSGGILYFIAGRKNLNELLA